MKKSIALFAMSLLLVSANYAQTGTKSSDTTKSSHKMMKKSMHRGSRLDSSNRGNGSLYPMNSGTGRADSTNSTNGTMMPGQTTNPTQTPVNPTQMPTNPTQTPTNPTPATPTPTPVPNK